MIGGRSRGAVVADVAFVWLAMAIGAAAMWPVYQGGRYLALVAIGLAVGSAIAIAGARLRWRAWVVAVVTAGGFLVLGVPVAVPEQAIGGVVPTLEGLGELVAAVALGWRRLLTITLPVGSYQALLVPAFVLVLGGAVAAISIALRTRVGELAAVLPVLLLLAGIVFGPESVPWPSALGIAMFATIMLWFAIRRVTRRRAALRRLAARTVDADGASVRASDRGSGVRTAVAATVLLAVAACAAVVATTVAPPESGRDVLRQAVEQPFDPRDDASPLSGLRRYYEPGAADAAMLRIAGLPEAARVRIATLDSYDGVVYAVGGAADGGAGTFARVPTRVDRDDAQGERVEATVAVLGYAGPWVPTVGDLETIDFRGARAAGLRDSFFFDATSGTAATLEGLAADDAYELQAVIPDGVAGSSLDALTPGSAIVPRIDRMPDELAVSVEQYAGQATAPGARLQNVIDGVRADGYISHGIADDEPPSRSGHAADRITELLEADVMIGDAEQYAVAAALMARQVGFPARVVVGFAPDPDATGPAGSGPVESEPGVATIVGADATAWIEVSTAERGWVSIDPVPPVRPVPEQQEEEPDQVPRPQSPVLPPPDDPDPRDDPSPPETSQDDQDQPDALLAALLLALRIIAIVVAAAAILLLPFLVVAGAKLRRRRIRRTAPSPVQRISGGWDEFHDAMIDRGYSTPVAATRSEIALASPIEQSRTLAAVADRAVFGPGQPDDAESDRVWRAVDELRALLDRGRTRRQRLAALVSLRSLGGYTVRNLFTR